MGKKFLSIILAFTMVLSLGIPAFAAENEPTATNSPRLVSYADMPDEYKQVISSDAVIFQNKEGSYDIFQNNLSLFLNKSVQPTDMHLTVALILTLKMVGLLL